MSAELLCNLLGAVFLFPLGLALGSFLELAVYRIPRGESIISPPSHCRSCSRRLSPAELIPLVSYLVQGGRCRGCDAAIGSGVPFREAVSGLILALPWLVFGCSETLPALLVGASLLGAGWLAFGLRQFSANRRR